MDVKEDVTVTTDESDGQFDESILSLVETFANVAFSFVAKCRCFDSIAVTDSSSNVIRLSLISLSLSSCWQLLNGFIPS